MENNDNQPGTPTLMSHALRYGSIMGVIGIVLTLLFYAVDFSLLADWKIGILLFLIFIGFVMYAGIDYRKKVGGYLSYGNAFKHSFITFAIGGLIGTIANIVLYGLIDPELPQKLTEVGLENTESMMSKFGAPQDKIDEQMDQLRETLPAQFSVFGLIKGYGIGLIIYAVLSAITALFIRKNVPEAV